MPDLIKCRTTMRPDDWLYVDQAEYDDLLAQRLLIIGPTQVEIAQRVVDEAKAAAAAKPSTNKKGT